MNIFVIGIDGIRVQNLITHINIIIKDKGTHLMLESKSFKTSRLTRDSKAVTSGICGSYFSNHFSTV